jgi:hypothetical protein
MRDLGQKLTSEFNVKKTTNLKFQLNWFEKIIGKIVEFILTLLHVREKHNQKEYNAVDDLRSDRVNCKTIADKIRFNEAVDHFIGKQKKSLS